MPVAIKKLKQNGNRILYPAPAANDPSGLMEANQRGRYSDGGGLYYVVGSKGERRWAFLFKSRTAHYATGEAKVHELGLGGAPHGDKPAVSLADARRKAEAARRLLADGKDPLSEKRASAVAAVASAKAEVAASAAFGDFADTYVARKTPEFKNPIHIKQWIRSLTVQAAPLRPMTIQDIDTTAVLSVLRPIWTTTPESAKRLQERIEKVLNAATVEGLRTGPNPAQWVGHLKETLATRKQSDKKNHAALPFKDAPAFMVELLKLTSVSARALEWTMLCAARTGETIGARWPEIDFEQRVWTVPAERMKAKKEHRVPLTDRAIQILHDVRRFSRTGATDYVFQNGTKGLSNMAMTECLKRLRPDVTVHGMRSTFSDWANEITTHDSKVIEFALSHIIGDKAEKAYRRGDALEKRCALMADWELYLLSQIQRKPDGGFDTRIRK
jgi:integrase